MNKMLRAVAVSMVISMLGAGCATAIPGYAGNRRPPEKTALLRLDRVTIEEVNGVVPQYTVAYGRQRDDNTIEVPAGKNIIKLRYRHDKWTSERTWSDVFKREILVEAGQGYAIDGTLHPREGVFRLTTRGRRGQVVDLVERPLAELKHRSSGFDWSDYKE